MYKLLFNGETVYDPRGVNETHKLIIRDPSVELGVSKAGSIRFTIGRDHPLCETLTQMHGVLELQDDGDPIFRGRILKKRKTFRLDYIIEAEGAMACLNDSIVEPYNFPEDFSGNPSYTTAAQSGNVVAFWLGWLLNQHNAQVGTEQQIKLGTVTVTDPNNYVARSNEKYSNTWETIRDKLANSSLGGHLVMRYEADGNYLDYLSSFSTTNVQTVEYAKNLLDFTDETYGGDLFTAILPVGSEGLTIAGLPDGTTSGTLVKSGKIIYDSAAVATYGRITKVVEWEDVTEAANLQTKAAAELAAGVSMPETIECKACDLHGIDGNIPSFRIAQMVNVVSSPHGLSDTYPLMDLKPDIFHPGNTDIVMGKTIQGITDSAAASAQIAQAAQETSKQASNIVSGLIVQVAGAASTASSAQSAAASAASTANSAQSTAQSAASTASANTADITQLRSDYAALVVRVQQLEENS